MRENVFFYDVSADGYSLDDKRDKISENDLPDVVIRWKKWDHGKKSTLKDFEDRTQKAFYVPRKEIVENEYDLSIGKYKEHIYEEVKYDHPKKILTRLMKLEEEITADMKKLGEILG